MSQVPPDLKYSSTHQWAKQETDGRVTVGITDHAQAELGDLVFVDLPEVGNSVQAGRPCMVVESVKSASDVHAPVSGEIVEINRAVADRPEQINDQPYEAWLLRIHPADPSELDALLDAEAYLSLIGAV